MKHHQAWMRCLCIFAVIAIAAGAVAGAAHVLQRKDSYKIHQEFYQHGGEFDVLFFGTSHVQNALSPMDLWSSRGIPSYNFGSPNCRISVSYWLLQNALQYCSPRAVVVDCAYLYDAKAAESAGYNHTAFDAMPFSLTKVRAMCDLFDTSADRLRYLFPFSLYHNRWDEIAPEDFENPVVPGKMGFAPEIGITSTWLPEQMTDAVQPVDNLSTQYLRRLIQECQAAGIDVLLTFLPFRMNADSVNDASFIQQIADEYQLHYLNPNDFLAILDTETDFFNNSNNNSHLNPSGAHKVSRFLADYLARNYGVPDRREDPGYAHWMQLEQQYNEVLLSALKQETSLKNYLMLLSNPDYCILAEVQDPILWRDPEILHLFENLGVAYSMLNENTNAVMIRDGGAESAVYQDFWNDESTRDTLLGSFAVRWDENGNRTLLRGGEIVHETIPYERSNVGIRLLVFDRHSGVLLDDAAFDTESHGVRMTF